MQVFTCNYTIYGEIRVDRGSVNFLRRASDKFLSIVYFLYKNEWTQCNRNDYEINLQIYILNMRLQACNLISSADPEKKFGRGGGVIDWLSNKVGRGSKPYFYEFYNLNLKSFLGGLDPLDPS